MFEELAKKAGQWTPSLSEMFSNDPGRATRYVAEGAGLRFDYSKHWVDDSVMLTLLDLANGSELELRRSQFFAGERVNRTENRAALHMALRADSSDHYAMNGASVVPSVLSERKRVYAFAEDVRAGRVNGETGQIFTDVVNIGIGGSDLGPLLVADALSSQSWGPVPHFVSNVDGAHFADTLLNLRPETTLFVVASKSFATEDTMHNAAKAKIWISESLGDSAVLKHFAAVSANRSLVTDFGISDERNFGIQDWVGGRYSVWSSIGLPLMLALGPEIFDRFLSGARSMDQHFKDAPFARNIPVLMALLGVWYRNGFGLETHAVLPYAQRLARLPAYLQQLEMESNGKRIDLNGDVLNYGTCPVIWGEPGTNGQHSFYQLLHQGTLISPIDFLLAANPTNTDRSSHQLLMSNCLAQSESLAFGKKASDVANKLTAQGLSKERIKALVSHRTFPGNRPSSLILFDRLSPEVLGAMIAAYEHKVFTQGVIWNVNSFDQWGVELGKEQCRDLLPAFDTGDAEGFSSATQEALSWLLNQSD